MALGKPCGAVIPRYHPPLWLSEGCKRNSRAPLVRRLFLAFRPSPSHHRGQPPRLQYEGLPGAFRAWREPAIWSGLAPGMGGTLLCA